MSFHSVLLYVSFHIRVDFVPDAFVRMLFVSFHFRQSNIVHRMHNRHQDETDLLLKIKIRSFFTACNENERQINPIVIHSLVSLLHNVISSLIKTNWVDERNTKKNLIHEIKAIINWVIHHNAINVYTCSCRNLTITIRINVFKTHTFTHILNRTAISLHIWT